MRSDFFFLQQFRWRPGLDCGVSFEHRLMLGSGLRYKKRGSNVGDIASRAMGNLVPTLSDASLARVVGAVLLPLQLWLQFNQVDIVPAISDGRNGEKMWEPIEEKKAFAGGMRCRSASAAGDVWLDFADSRRAAGGGRDGM